jgi:hypothetical protein
MCLCERTFVHFYFFDLQWHDYVLCELIFEMYAYRFKFTGEGVFMHKKKDGGIACQKWASSAQSLVPWPDHPAADWASPAEPPDYYSKPPFGGPPNLPGEPSDSRRAVPVRNYRRSVRPRGRCRRTYRQTAAWAASNDQISTHLEIPILPAGVGLELHQPLFIFEALTFPHYTNTKFHRSPLLANQSSWSLEEWRRM